MKRHLLVVMVAGLGAWLAPALLSQTARERFLLDYDWRFAPGDNADSTKDFGFDHEKPEAPSGPATPGFRDRDWKPVDVPHDYVVEGTFDRTNDMAHGYLRAGVGWYRKSFIVPARAKGRSVWIDFDGVYRDSMVWFNGKYLGRHASGYTSFRYDISDVADYGGANVLTVRTDASRFEGWWYEGGGIYRHVWLDIADPVHIAPWGVFVATEVSDPLPAPKVTARATILTTVTNAGAAEIAFELVSEIQAADGKAAGLARSAHRIPPHQILEVKHEVPINQAHLWSLESPYLYRLSSIVEKAGRKVDNLMTPFGVRTIRFDADKGFFLNGKPVKIKGVCNHQDFAGVGVALPDRLHTFRVEKLKEMGANAWRCSHNPPAAELLDACDALGMLVMDENRRLGNSPEVLSQVESMVLRDRNHPSIVLWSLCNEERLQGSEEGARRGRAMKDLILKLDPTRPVTAAMNGGYGHGLADVIDVQGFNYHASEYAGYHTNHPRQSLLGSETASTVSTRGIYANDKAKGYVSAYDTNFPPWAATAQAAWRPVAEAPYMAGAFVWTGFDYKGEPTPYEWPCVNSHFGILDLCGFPKDNFYYYQAWWSDKTVLHVFPHWTWPGKEGQEIEVWCHSNCDAVELTLNGRSLGTQNIERNSYGVWKVPYHPGTLVAKGIRGTKVIATTRIETTTSPVSVLLTPDRSAIHADGQDVSLVTASVVDARGRWVPIADQEINFEISGVGKLIGVGNGDPSSHEPDKATKRHAFNGLCQALIQATKEPGDIQLTARAPGLRPASISLRTERCLLPPSIP